MDLPVPVSKTQSNGTLFVESWSTLWVFEVRYTAVLTHNFPQWRHFILFFLCLAEASKKISQQILKKVMMLSYIKSHNTFY